MLNSGFNSLMSGTVRGDYSTLGKGGVCGRGRITSFGAPALSSRPSSGLQEGDDKGRGRHREAPISTLVSSIAVGQRSQGEVLSIEETSDGGAKRVIHLFLDKFSTQRSYKLQITETHASMKFNFQQFFPGASIESKLRKNDYHEKAIIERLGGE